MKLGCHAVLFKEKIKEDPDFILKNFSEMGYRGVEIGSRFFGTEDRAFLQEKLAQYHMELSAMHVGSPLVDWLTRPKELCEQIAKVADFVSVMPNKNVLLSGNREHYEASADAKQIAQQINEAAKMCADKGVTLHYHNHDLEFQQDGKIYHNLAQYAPDLCFGLDLGWIYVGGMDPLQVLHEQAGRVHYVHLRDTIGVGVRDFAALGEGTLDLPKLLACAEEVVGETGWGVVEFDKGEPDMERCRQAKRYLDAFGQQKEQR